MPRFELYSKRNKDIVNQFFIYDELPKKFRYQVLHIWDSAIGTKNRNYRNSADEVFEYISNTMCREHGLLNLTNTSLMSASTACRNFLINENDNDKALDIIELSFYMIDKEIRKHDPYEKSRSNISQDADDAIEELNHRFKENGLGYQYANGQLVRMDSTYLHSEAVEPSLEMLFEEGFDGASEEFLKAHEYYRKGENKAAINEALKAFESVMKTICRRMNWDFNEKKATASTLINILFDNGLIPNYMQTHFESLKSTLLGLPTVRNKTSSHGQGEDLVTIPEFIVSYALHLCATNILLIISAYKEKNKK